MDYYSAIKRGTLESVLMRWMNLTRGYNRLETTIQGLSTRQCRSDQVTPLKHMDFSAPISRRLNTRVHMMAHTVWPVTPLPPLPPIPRWGSSRPASPAPRPAQSPPDPCKAHSLMNSRLRSNANFSMTPPLTILRNTTAPFLPEPAVSFLFFIFLHSISTFSS